MLGDELFALRCTDPCDEGGGCVCARVWRGGVDPSCIANYDAILFLGDDGCKVAVLLALSKVGGLQLRECPPSSFSSASMAFGVMMPVILEIRSLWAKSISYAPFLEDLFAILVSACGGRGW